MRPGDLQLRVTDSGMPRMSGPDLANLITTMRPGIRVLFMSGHSEQLLGEPARPGRAFIQKPFTPRTCWTRCT